MMRYMYNMMGWDGGYWGGYGMMGGCGGGGLITTLLVWTILVLVIALLWKKLNK